MTSDQPDLSKGGRRRRPAFAVLAGVPVALLAGLVVLGWLVRIPWMVQIIPGTTAMVFANAVCLLLLAIALILTTDSRPWSRPLQAAIGIGVLLTGATVLVQYRFDLALPLDLPGLHAWLNGNPGRMAPNTALAHALAGLTVLLAVYAGPGMRALPALAGAFAVAMLGVTGLVGYRLQPELLYGWHIETRMALHTGAAFVLLGTGFGVAMYRARQLGELFRGREDLRVGLLAGALMVVVGLVGGIVAFALMQQQLLSVLHNSLRFSFHSRHDLIVTEIMDAIRDNRTFAGRTGVQRGLARLRDRPGDPVARQFLTATVQAHVETERSGARLFDHRGRLVASAGGLPGAQLELPLQHIGDVVLLWDGQVVGLRVAKDIVADGRRLGRIETTQLLPGVTRMREVTLGLGESSDMVLCVSRAAAIRCLPTVLYPDRTEIPAVTHAGPVLMARALAGESGVGLANDYRGQRVIAAYGPVGDLGLGLVLKVDAAEIYTPLRQRFELTLLVIALIIGAGIVLLRARLVPLVRQLAFSERRWQFALEGARDGVWDWNLVTNEVYFSRQWKQMLGYEEHEIAASLDEWDRRVHPDDKARAYADIRRHLDGEAPYYQNEHRLRCKDGSYKWILDRGMIVARDAGGKPTRMIGTHTDITERKRDEETIRELSLVDELTGLRNRRGFFVLGEAQLGLAHRLGRSVVLYFADVDGFKRINDEFGHAAGDRALADVAGVLRAVFRETDVLARLGGDEFVVLALESPDVDADVLRVRIEQRLEEFNRQAGRRYRLAVSVGVARQAPGTSESLAALLDRADADMYQVKQQRRAGR